MVWYTTAMLVRSANRPSTAAPSPPMPKAKPKNSHRDHRLAASGAGVMRGVPTTHLEQQANTQQCGEPEPGNTALAEGHDDQGREQRSDGRAGVAAHLEHRLCEAMLAT